MTLCVLAKWPVPGRVKSRLAASLGDERAAVLARAFLEDVVSSLTQTRHPVSVSLEGAPAGAAGLPFLRGCEVRDQGTGDLGERMVNALGAAMDHGSSWALVLGSDAVGLPPDHLAQATAHLADPSGPDVVLGPAMDGGYYLLGVRAPHREALRAALLGVRFGTEHAREDTLDGLKREDLSVALLAVFFDVDHAEDLLRLSRHLDMHPEIACPATRRALELPSAPLDASP